MGIHDVTTPYLGMLTLPLPYMGIGSRDMVWRDHDGGREVPGGSKRGQRGSKIKVCSILINGVSFERYDLPDFEFFGFMFSISKVNWIIDLNWS